MNDASISGLFALAGTLIGGLISYLTSRIGHQWDRAQKDILRLCDQVSAFYQLEQIYKDELAKLDPEHRSAKTIMEEMRVRVEKTDGYERPEMAPSTVRRIRQNWS